MDGTTTLKEWKDELKAVQAHVKSVGFKGDDHPFANQIAIIKKNIADLEKKPAAAETVQEPVE
jgi:hypothetical protein